MSSSSPSLREAQLRALFEARLEESLSEPEPGPEPTPGLAGRVDPDAPVPLSPAQRSMWLAWRSEPADPAYNVPLVLRLSGTVDRVALVRAVRQVAERHAVLRSLVTVDADENPSMVAQATVPVRERTVAREDVDRELRAEANRPFDLLAEAPMRVVLFRLDADFLLAMTFHHIAADAFARAALLQDLSDCYRALVLGGSPPPPAGQYAEAAAAQGPVEPDDVAWWASTLANLGPPLELPSVAPRSLPPWPAGEVPVEISEQLHTRLKETAAEFRCSPFMVLLAGFDLLLAKICGTADVVVGTPDSGRPHEDLRNVVGCFVNTLAIRADLSGDPTGAELLHRVRDAALDAFSRAAVPFERVVAAANPARDPRTSPVFQAMLNVYDAPRSADGLVGVATVEDVAVPLETAKYDLVWHVIEGGPHGVRSSLVYRADTIDRELAERMSGWLVAAMTGLVADPQVPISRIPLERFTAPTAAGPRLAPPEEDGVHELVVRWARRTPEAVAVVGADRSLTYAQLDRWADRIAGELRAAGVRAGQPVGLFFHRNAALVAAILATWKAAGYYVPLDPAYPAERIDGIVASAGIRVVLTERELAGRLPVEFIDVAEPPADEEDVKPLQAAVSRNDPAYAVFTSGSTGAPKGVVVEHGNLLGYLQGLRHLVGDSLGETPSFALVSTIAADLGLTNVFGALTTGGTLHVLKPETSVDPQSYAAYLNAHPVDAIKMVPSHLQLLAAHGDLAAVLPKRLLILAGEACPWRLTDRIRSLRPDLRVHVHYGPTETTVSVLGGDVAETASARRGGIVPLGRPLSNVDCYVVGPDGAQLPAGAVGELLVGGPGVARGYLGRPDLTAERFVADPLGGSTRCYRTGDRVRAAPDGRIEFLGRADDQVKIRGYRVEPAEVQAVLRAIAGVDDAAVLPVGNPPAQRLAAWAAGSGLDAGEIRAALRQRLPDYLVPSAVVVLDALPLTPNGKVDRAALPVPDDAGEERREPATGTEKTVAAAWQEVLGHREFGVTDDFFALGGDSFLALRAARAISPRLRMAEFFGHPTVRALSAFLDDQGEAEAANRLLHSFAGPAADRESAVTLVCLPYGGGTAAAYHGLANALDPSVRLYAAELPGHDPARAGERLLPLPELVGRLAEEIVGRVAGPVAVYGHSSGAATAVALAGTLETRGATVTEVIVGARLPGPQDDSGLSDEDYRQALRDIGGFSGEMDPAAERTMIRALRHDAAQAREWFAEARAGRHRKLAAPLLCVVGDADPGTRSYRQGHLGWRAAAERVDLAVLPGAGHYFLRHRAGELAELIGKRIARPRERR